MKPVEWELLIPACGTSCDCVSNCIVRRGSLSGWAAQKSVDVLPEDSFNHKLLSWSFPLTEILVCSCVLRFPFRNKEHIHVPQEIVKRAKMDYSCCAGTSSLWKMISAKVLQIKIILVSRAWDADGWRAFWPNLCRHLRIPLIFIWLNSLGSLRSYFSVFSIYL